LGGEGSPKGRAAGEKARETGSHTMQSIGVYSTEDNNKPNLIGGGGGVLYEHDITDDEDGGKDDNGEGETEAGESADTGDDEPKDIWEDSHEPCVARADI